MNTIIAHDINNAWREAIEMCVMNGKDYIVEGGSYIGQIRRQLEYVMVVIEKPGHRPLAPILPPGIPAPTNEYKIADYFERYIFGTEKRGKEVYTYGEFIGPQYTRCLELLIDSRGNTNQATIAVGDKETTFLDDPPCLRSISFKVVEGKLNTTVYFRSWDLYTGFPENLGGLQLLKEMLLGELQELMPVRDGMIIAFSDGLHIYEQYFGLVNQLNVQQVKVSTSVSEEKKNFIFHHGV